MDSDQLSVTASINLGNQIPTLLKGYDYNKRFTFYSERTEILQSNNIYQLHEKESLANLMKETSYWLDLTGSTRSDLKTISDLFEIHPLTIEDILSEDGRDKCERFEKYIFISVRTCDDADNEKTFNLAQISDQSKIFILLFKNCLITIHSKPIRQFKNVLKRLNPLKNIFTVTSDWYMYALLDDVVDEFVPNIKSIEFEVESIDELVLYLKRINQTEMLRRIGRARNHVNYFISQLKPKIEIINIITKRHIQYLEEHTQIYIRDTQDHLITMIQNLEQSSEILNRSHNNYLAQISIELAEMSNRMNLQVKILTQITTLALPFAIICGLWGMNVIVPFEIVNGSMATWDMLVPFWSLVFVSIVLSAGFWFMGRQMKFF